MPRLCVRIKLLVMMVMRPRRRGGRPHAPSRPRPDGHAHLLLLLPASPPPLLLALVDLVADAAAGDGGEHEDDEDEEDEEEDAEDEAEPEEPAAGGVAEGGVLGGAEWGHVCEEERERVMVRDGWKVFVFSMELSAV